MTSPSSSSTSRKSKSLKTRNCCSEAVSSRVSSRVPSSEDTWLGWRSISSRSPQEEKITWQRKMLDSVISYYFHRDKSNVKKNNEHLSKSGGAIGGIKRLVLLTTYDTAQIHSNVVKWLEWSLTDGFLLRPTSWPHRDSTFTSFSRVRFWEHKGDCFDTSAPEGKLMYWLKTASTCHL